MRLKIDLYRRLGRVSNDAELADIQAELADRFGPPPPEVQHLIELAEMRVAAHGWGIMSIHLEDQFAVFRYSSGRQIRQLADLSGGKLRVVDGQSAYLPLDKEVTNSAAVLGEVKSLLRQKGSDVYNPGPVKGGIGD